METQHIRICGMLLTLLNNTNNKPKMSRRKGMMTISVEINERNWQREWRKILIKSWSLRSIWWGEKREGANYQHQQRERHQPSQNLGSPLGMELLGDCKHRGPSPGCRAARLSLVHHGHRAVGSWGHCGPGEDEWERRVKMSASLSKWSLDSCKPVISFQSSETLDCDNFCLSSVAMLWRQLLSL